MMFRDYCQIMQVCVGIVFHIVRVPFRAIVHLALSDSFGNAVIIKRGRSADDVHYLAVSFMPMQTARCSRAQAGSS